MGQMSNRRLKLKMSKVEFLVCCHPLIAPGLLLGVLISASEVLRPEPSVPALLLIFPSHPQPLSRRILTASHWLHHYISGTELPSFYYLGHCSGLLTSPLASTLIPDSPLQHRSQRDPNLKRPVYTGPVNAIMVRWSLTC